MPISHVVDRESRLIRAKVWGEFTVAEVLATVTGAAGEAGTPGYNIISDHTEVLVPATRLHVEGLTMVMTTLRAVFAGSRWAVVVSNPTSYGMMRMLAVYLEEVPVELRVFTDAVEAEAWVMVESRPAGGAARTGGPPPR